MPCRIALQAAQSPQCLWITDDLLNEAWNRFLRVSHSHSHLHRHTTGRRHGSNVPGPLEAHRRLARRRMGMTAVGSGVQSGGAEFGALFGFGGYGARLFDPAKDLKWKPPGREKVKKEEHWMFPKSAKRKPVFDTSLPTPKQLADPVATSKSAFKKLLGRIAQRERIGEEDLRQAFDFLQSSENEPKAHNVERLCEWLNYKSLGSMAVPFLANLAMDKIRLGTIVPSYEIPQILASLITAKADSSHVLSILDCLSQEALHTVCAPTTALLFTYTCGGHGHAKVKKLPDAIERWLRYLRSCQRLAVYHAGDPIWHSIYEVLASRTFSSATVAAHLYHLKRLELCLILLRFWAPLNASTEVAMSQLTTFPASKRLNFLQPNVDANTQVDVDTLLADFKQGRDSVSRRRLKDMNIFVSMFGVLQQHGLAYGDFARDLFAILTTKAQLRGHGAMIVYEAFLKLQEHRSLGVPDGLAEKLVLHFLSNGSKHGALFAHQIFLRVPTLPLSLCYSLPIMLARTAAIPSSEIWNILNRQTPEDVVWTLDERIGSADNRLMQPHIDLVHLVAHEFAKCPHLTSRMAFRRVWECYRFLRDRGAPIEPLLTRAMVTAGVVRPIQRFHRPSTIQFRYILSIVGRVEGEEIAEKLDQAVWKVWRRQVSVGIGLQRQLRRRIFRSLSDVTTAPIEKNRRMFRLRAWSKKGWEHGRKMRKRQDLGASTLESASKYTPLTATAGAVQENAVADALFSVGSSMTSFSPMELAESTALSTSSGDHINLGSSQTVAAGKLNQSAATQIGQPTTSWSHSAAKDTINPSAVKTVSSSWLSLESTSASAVEPSLSAHQRRARAHDNRAVAPAIPIHASPTQTPLSSTAAVHASPIETKPGQPTDGPKSTNEQSVKDATITTKSNQTTIQIHRAQPSHHSNSADALSILSPRSPPTRDLIKLAKESDGTVITPDGHVYLLWDMDKELIPLSVARRKLSAIQTRAEIEKRKFNEEELKAVEFVKLGQRKMSAVIAKKRRAEREMRDGGVGGEAERV